VHLCHSYLCIDQDVAEPPEDELSMVAHLAALQRECQKSAPSSTVIAEKMARTVAHRSQLIQDKRLPEVLEAYPCLRIEREVLCLLQ